MPSRILVAEDQPDILEVILSYLERENYQCEGVPDGLSASARIREGTYDLLVLDWMMAGLDGLALCQLARQKWPAIPILIVSARGSDEDRVTGLQAGADDFLPKPFHPRELVARVRALLRRKTVVPSSIRRHGDLEIDLTARTVLVRGQAVPFSSTELSLFLALASRPEATLNRQELLDLAWGGEFACNERTVDSHVRALRAKLNAAAPGNQWLESVWGVGYRFNPEGS